MLGLTSKPTYGTKYHNYHNLKNPSRPLGYNPVGQPTVDISAADKAMLYDPQNPSASPTPDSSSSRVAINNSGAQGFDLGYVVGAGIQAGTSIATTIATNNTNQAISDASLEESARQFDEQMKWAQEQYRDQQEYSEYLFDQQMGFNDKWNQANLDWQREMQDYQKELNATQMAREDTSIQRAMQDARAAGLSPLAALGMQAPSQTFSAPAPLNYDTSGGNAAFGELGSSQRNARSEYGRNYRAAQELRARAREMKADRDLARNTWQAEQWNKIASYAGSAYRNGLENKVFKAQLRSLELDNERKEDENEWLKSHSYRNLNLQSELINFIEKFIGSDLPKKTKSKLDDYLDSIHSENEARKVQRKVSKALKDSDSYYKLRESDPELFNEVVKPAKYAQLTQKCLHDISDSTKARANRVKAARAAWHYSKDIQDAYPDIDSWSNYYAFNHYKDFIME